MIATIAQPEPVCYIVSRRRRDFRSLSVTPLLDVRDAFHAQLLHYENVVGTAIGLYRIRASDSDAAEFDDPHDLVERRLEHAQPDAEPRTLENSMVRPWSWPCILVFVDKWMSAEDIQRRPDAAVPPFLYARQPRRADVRRSRHARRRRPRRSRRSRRAGRHA